MPDADVGGGVPPSKDHGPVDDSEREDLIWPPGRAMVLLGRIMFWGPIIALFLVVQGGMRDFPGRHGMELPPAGTRISYCISRSTIFQGGGGGYSRAHTPSDHVEIPGRPFWYSDIEITRRGKNCEINGKLLKPGERREWTRWYPSLNPWRLNTVRFSVYHSGVDPHEQMAKQAADTPPTATDVLYIDGQLRESFYPIPLGFLLIWGGWRLIKRGKQKLAQHAIGGRRGKGQPLAG